MRAAAIVILAVTLLAHGPRDVRAQGGAVFSVSPPALELRESAGVLEVRVSGAPPVGGYQFELSWDPSFLVVTAVAPGGFMGVDDATVFTPRFVGADRLAIGEVLPGSPPSGEYPSGSGTLAFVTVAAIGDGGIGEASGAVTLHDANLVGPAGEGIPATRTVPGQVTVAVPAPEAQQAAAVAQATALAAELGRTPARLPIEIPDVADLPAPGSNAIWLGLLLVALLVVVIGWFVGRDDTRAGGR